LKDDEVLRLIQTSFVPVAVDQHVHRQLKDAEGKLFAKVLQQAGRGLDGYSQGVYCFTTDGKLLAFSNTSDADHVKRLLTGALAKFDPLAAASSVQPTDPTASAESAASLPQPPDGGLIVDVTTKVLSGYEQSTHRMAPIWQNSLGRDHLWIRSDEADALARGVLPDSVARRIVRFNLVDNTRGEPPMWRDAEVKKLEVTLRDGRLSGSVHVETNGGDRGFEADLLGSVESQDGKVTRFDLVIKGQFWGDGSYTRGAPPGKFPLAVAFRLSADDCAAQRVPPQGARGNLRDYLR
jgi:hypothetical protein